MFLKDSLIVHVVLPVLALPNEFNIAVIHNFGVQMPGNNPKSPKQQQGITKLSDTSIPQVLATTDDNDIFLDLTLNEAIECVQNYEGLCPQIRNYRSSYATDCIISIYLDNLDNIADNCDFHLYPSRTLAPAIYNIGPSRFLLNGVGSPVTLMCPTGSKRISVDMQQILEIPCNCHIQSEHFKTTANIHNCDVTVQQPKTQYIQSLPMTLYFNYSDKLDFGSTVTTSNKPVSLPIYRM